MPLPCAEVLRDASTWPVASMLPIPRDPECSSSHTIALPVLADLHEVVARAQRPELQPRLRPHAVRPAARTPAPTAPRGSPLSAMNRSACGSGRLWLVPTPDGNQLPDVAQDRPLDPRELLRAAGPSLPRSSRSRCPRRPRTASPPAASSARCPPAARTRSARPASAPGSPPPPAPG